MRERSCSDCENAMMGKCTENIIEVCGSNWKHYKPIDNVYGLAQEVQWLKQENKQLREALKKCTPWDGGLYDCAFCGDKKWHTDDCEYVRLTGG